MTAPRSHDELEAFLTTVGVDATLASPAIVLKPPALDTPVPAGLDGPALLDPFDALLAALPHLTTQSADEAPLSAQGAPIAELQIVGTLGEGGMGIVLLAEQVSLGRRVAVKVARVSAKGRAPVRALLHEARLMGSLEHPGVIPVHALGRDTSGRPVLVMKRVEGTSWQELLDDADHPRWSELSTLPKDRLCAHLEILMQVASTIAFAHSRGIVHLDIKPENVLVGSFGEVYVADWGIAIDRESTDPAMRVGPRGTPRFMAPELVTGTAADIDGRTDVYLLGSTLHLILTGAHRHDGETMQEVLEAAIASVPFDYGGDGATDLADLANRATSRERDDRPASALAFREEVSAHLRHRGAIATSTRAWERIREAEEGGDSAEVAARRRKLLLEARFGFQQALVDHPTYDGARAGLERAVELAFDLELADRALGSARALLADLDTPRPDLDARAAQLEQTLRREIDERDRLRTEARDRDPTVDRVKRTLILATLAIVGIGVTFGMRSSRLGGTAYPELHTPFIPLAIAAALGPLVVWQRRAVAASAHNRKLVATVYFAFVLSSIVRFIGLFARTPMDHVMAYELVVIGACCGVLAIAIERAFVVPALLGLGGAFGALLWSSWLEIFYVPAFAALVVVSVMAGKRAASEPRDASPAAS